MSFERNRREEAPSQMYEGGERPPVYIEGEEGAFHSTYNDRESAEKVARARGGIVKPFGVNLKNVDPQTKKAVDWEKAPGYSVWV